ncbi:MAG: TetR/AcrR family transcriptional regulator [Candidatus Izemoplasmatales bacterium]|nr:TetR/AcrR family transcriptional regulator [Candidatus Izemoplasmatales bacterium]
MPSKTFINLEAEKRKRIVDAVVEEFSSKPYEQVMISDIIKKAKIPRGSFYQYFTDKEDLYFYIIEVIKQEKMSFLQNTLDNLEGLKFLDLVRKLYEDGIKFALKYPSYVKIMDFLMKNKNPLYDRMLAENLAYAETIYANLIDKDKAKGYIRDDIDSLTFAKIVVQFTTYIAIEELDTDNEEESFKRMLERNNQILKIIEYGVLKG